MSGEEMRPRAEFSDILNAAEWLETVQFTLELKYDCQEEIELAIEWFKSLSVELIERDQLKGDKVSYFERIARGLELSEKRIRNFAIFNERRLAFREATNDDIIYEQFLVLFSIENR